VSISKIARFVIAATMYFVSSPAFSACQYYKYVAYYNWPDDVISKNAFYAVGEIFGECFESFSESAQGACDAFVAVVNANQSTSKMYSVSLNPAQTIFTPWQTFYWGQCKSSGGTEFINEPPYPIRTVPLEPLVVADIYKLREPKINTYSITLSGNTSVEPWHKKADADHKKTNLSYTATVTSSGYPAPNVEVTITTDVTQDSGGHVHINGRHKGKLAIPTEPIKDGKETITGYTDNNGVFSFVFGSEEASGTHTLTAKCSTGCEAPATATVKVEIKGLSLLDGDPLSYTLNGETSTHPGSHYFSAAALVQIINLAHKFSHDPAYKKQLLTINDSSLIKGGVFDLGQDWTYTPNGHQGHRVGVVVDINNFHEKDPDFVIFAKECCDIKAVWEGPEVTSTPHYHLWLIGKDQ